jgi:hypothetical protein
MIFWILVLFFFGFAFFFQARTISSRNSPLSGWIQLGILLLFVLGTWSFRTRVSIPTTWIVLDVSKSHWIRLLEQWNRESPLYKEIRALLENRTGGRFGLILFAQEPYPLIFATSSSDFLKKIHLFLEEEPRRLWEGRGVVGSLEKTHFLALDRFLQERDPGSEVFIFTDGHFEIPSFSSCVYFPRIVPMRGEETQIVEFFGPSLVTVDTPVFLQVRLRGTAQTERTLVVFQEGEVFFSRRVFFSEEKPFWNESILCPVLEKEGVAVRYEARLFPLEREVLEENNRQLWTLFVQKRSRVLVIDPEGAGVVSFFSEAGAYEFFQTSEFPTRAEAFEGFSGVLLVPRKMSLPLVFQQEVGLFIRRGGFFLLLGTPDLSSVVGSVLEKDLPVFCGKTPENEMDIKFVLDVSGSMSRPLGNSSTTRLKACQEVLFRSFLQLKPLLSSHFRIEIWKVHHRGERLFSSQGESSLWAFQEALEGVQAQGQTFLKKSLEEILPSFSPSAKKILLLFSDGESQDSVASLGVAVGEEIHFFCLQLPELSSEAQGHLKALVRDPENLFSIHSLEDLARSVESILEKESEFYYRRGLFSVDLGNKEFLAVDGYARSRKRSFSSVFSEVQGEPFLACRSLEKGATGFLAIHPWQQKHWSVSQQRTYLEGVIERLEKQFKAPSSFVRILPTVIEVYAPRVRGALELQKEGQKKRYPLLPQGFGFYKIPREGSENESSWGLYEGEQKLYEFKPKSSVEGLEQWDLHRENLSRLASLPRFSSKKTLASPRRHSFSLFYGGFLAFFLFLEVALRSYPPFFFLKKRAKNEG